MSTNRSAATLTGDRGAGTTGQQANRHSSTAQDYAWHDLAVVLDAVRHGAGFDDRRYRRACAVLWPRPTVGDRVRRIEKRLRAIEDELAEVTS